MANADKTDKRKTRAARRAAEEAAAKARAEQAAKERKQQTIIGAIVVVVVIALVAVAGFAIWRSHNSSTASDSLTVDEAYSQLQAVKTKPSTADEKGGILLSKDGVNEKIDDVPTVAVYMDFMCSGCGNFERTAGETITKLVEAGQINLELHPMSFGDRWSSDEYSTRAANMLLSITEQDKDASHILGFITNMYAKSFQPEENSGKKTSDEQMKQQAVKAGVSQQVADAAVTDKYTDWLDAINTYTPKRTELLNVSGQLKGSMTTPTVTINGNFWDMNQLSTADLTADEGLVEALGLKDDQVGVEGQLPSIGADGKPVSLTTGE
ncbi:thioredoxin domain-containing protein [Bifidobacterium sp. MA2]|uniref:Thioredoxin domain-containing protein n=1 Tax=Bifidobacterium santillanense TaxID=2809028 RepID=A0ABS5UNZ5_9BIFI|nr:thioredoxin domain-containing protein [Bifidobacterium santillanense]MBT1172594.1 thioredoxin domain-containing protein [Bifidobacterium santillanense]